MNSKLSQTISDIEDTGEDATSTGRDTASKTKEVNKEYDTTNEGALLRRKKVIKSHSTQQSREWLERIMADNKADMSELEGMPVYRDKDTGQAFVQLMDLKTKVNKKRLNSTTNVNKQAFLGDDLGNKHKRIESAVKDVMIQRQKRR